MKTGHIPEERRLAACAELAELIEQLNAGAASLSKKLSLLAHTDQKHIGKVIATLTRYRAFCRLPCKEEVAAIEARLKGETVEKVNKLDQLRAKKAAAQAAEWEATRNNYQQLTESEDTLIRYLRCIPTREREETIASMVEALKSWKRNTAAARGSASKAAMPPSLFRVIEGGLSA